MAQVKATDGELERFKATNGRMIGVSGLVLCVAVAVLLALSESTHTAAVGAIACAFAGLFVWMTLLRPSVSASRTHLHLQNLFDRVSIPLASIDTVVVRRYLLVRSGGRKYICPAISRPLRRTVRKESHWGGQQLLTPGVSEETLQAALRTQAQATEELSYPDFVEQRIQALAADDRARRGIKERSEEEYQLGAQVERRTAWPWIAGLAVLAVAFVVSLLL